MSDGLLQTTPVLFGDSTKVPVQLQQYFHA